MKKRFTKSQIVATIKKQEAGMSVKDICREMGISEPTLYNRKSRELEKGNLSSRNVRRSVY